MTAVPKTYAGKYILDLTAAILLLILCLPAIVLVAALVYLLHGSPVLFRQKRAGFAGKPFEILKFRTMTNALDWNGAPLPDADRLTKFGNFLRTTSLDELPELLNVLRGEMSLVGPRPLHLFYVDRYTQEQRVRLEALPGITGLAQVRGRNALAWEDRFAMDATYVANMSFSMDLRILASTMLAVFRQTGITSQDHATMAEFVGSQSNSRLTAVDKKIRSEGKVY